jgi:formylglycine-generating enzyme required for sulfatase activity
VEGGTVQRQVFADNFGTLVQELGLGERPGRDHMTNSLWMKFVPIPAGQEAEIRRPFHLGMYEVTQDEYRQVMGKNPSWFSAAGGGKDLVRGDTGRLPVEQVSWQDAQEFCRELSNRPQEKEAGRSYRLPTEAEWEHACRAGTATVWSCGNKEEDLGANAWYAGNSDGTTHPVGEKKANAWGLYDMHGNVQEWCADHYDRKQALPFRVLRGGSWEDEPGRCRSAERHSSLEHFQKGKGYGFRVVLEIRKPGAE